MKRRFTAGRVWAAIEDWLIPVLRLTTHERALYYHLLRRTRLDGRRTVRVSKRKLARATGLSTYTARHYLRVLARKQCVRVVNRNQGGCLVEVRLPEEVRRRLGRRPSAERLVWAPHEVDRDAAGQPRAWPRSDELHSTDLRARILRREEGRCFYCRRRLRPREWSLDHVVAVARGGSDSPGNLVACCAPCNWEKGLTEAKTFLRSQRRKGVLRESQVKARLQRLRTLEAGK